MGGEPALSSELVSARRDSTRWRLTTTQREIEARVVITCAGLQSDRVARLIASRTKYQVVPFEGKYIRLSSRGSGLIRGLVYPVPLPGLPFLGVHFTRRIDDEVWVGPNAVLARGREGYGGRWNLHDLRESLTYPGTWRLLRSSNGAIALREEWQDKVNPNAFLRECRKYVPDLEATDLLRALQRYPSTGCWTRRGSDRRLQAPETTGSGSCRERAIPGCHHLSCDWRDPRGEVLRELRDGST